MNTRRAKGTSCRSILLFAPVVIDEMSTILSECWKMRNTTKDGYPHRDATYALQPNSPLWAGKAMMPRRD